MGATAAIVAISAIGAGASIENASQARRLAGQATDRQNHDQRVAEQQRVTEEEKASQQLVQDQLRQKKKGLAAENQGRAGTILNDPSAIQSNVLGSSSGGKTLLGA